MASTWKWQQTTHSSDFEDYAHLPVKCPRKITLYVMINPLLKGRKTYLQKKKYCWTSQFLRDKKDEKLCFLTVRSLGCDAQSCLSVSVLNCCLVLLPPQMSLGMCKGGCVYVCVCVCMCVCFHGAGGWSPSLHFRSPYGKTEVLVSTIKGMEGAISSFSSYFF